MAIFGNINILTKQVNQEKFEIAFDYLFKVIDETSVENSRLKSYSLNSFEKIELNNGNFALEQTYHTKDKEDCFYESHRKYIDVQFILKGEEIIEVDNINSLNVNFSYNDEMDLIKYENSDFYSSITLREGDVAIFFPDDAHMPCVKTNKVMKVIKTVIKVPID